MANVYWFQKEMFLLTKILAFSAAGIMLANSALGAPHHRYKDNDLVARINAIHWTGLNDIPDEQLKRIDGKVRIGYTKLGPVLPGSVLAYMLGLGDRTIPGEIQFGNDGLKYKTVCQVGLACVYARE